MVPRPPRPEAFLTPRPSSSTSISLSSRLVDLVAPFLTPAGAGPGVTTTDSDSHPSDSSTTTTGTFPGTDDVPAALALTAAIFAFLLVLLLFLSLRRPRRASSLFAPFIFLPWTRSNTTTNSSTSRNGTGDGAAAAGGSNPNRLSRHEMTSRPQSLYDPTGFNVMAQAQAGRGGGGGGGSGSSPRSSMYIPYLILGIAEHAAQQPLLERYRDEPDVEGDGPPLELDEATWERSDGKDGRPDVLHWHGTNMLNTAWGWMA
ncbi:hypothetical protein VFPFJ_00954 [Purpureocillium lilacinum]|uniref:Uncharacterized protein n=1 Tax=Purpureocillium lilacinum TaxID=33203 RepID=A0A179HWG7_PURLI|nr:hypothetical protein VFPFJ_00954 [Purpureocillium lilacinum]OAQ94845.1 hypothetical protein VFPFJ_00954 [Purpureocillium lilacinum]